MKYVSSYLDRQKLRECFPGFDPDNCSLILYAIFDLIYDSYGHNGYKNLDNCENYINNNCCNEELGNNDNLPETEENVVDVGNVETTTDVQESVQTSHDPEPRYTSSSYYNPTDPTLIYDSYSSNYSSNYSSKKDSYNNRYSDSYNNSYDSGKYSGNEDSGGGGGFD